MKIALVPSNQHQNTYTGLPSVTEERWAVAVCSAIEKRLLTLGADDVRTFHTPGTGASSTDELSHMVDRAISWRPDYMLSVHSDAVGDKHQTGILMLMARLEDALEGQRLGLLIAKHVGLPYKATWVYGLEARKILYLRRLRETGIKGSLVEVGEHATTAEARWNWEHIGQIGVGIADALAEYLGLRPVEVDDMTDEQFHLLKLARLSDVARSYDVEIIKEMVAGNMAGADELEAVKVTAVQEEKNRLGL